MCVESHETVDGVLRGKIMVSGLSRSSYLSPIKLDLVQGQIS